MSESRPERTLLYAPLRTRKEVRDAGYRNADDIAQGIGRTVRLNINYLIRLVIIGVQTLILRRPELARDIVVYKGAVYYGGRLLAILRRWVSFRARREYRNKFRTKRDKK